ncbi:MAG: glutamate-1-semialdehyde 2,1-aminomutase [Kiritimatiellae bacterium]|nr:glutamate-1-semialdehyde 2,1-aminomutase [Kiritimatiellia bacterium]
MTELKQRAEKVIPAGVNSPVRAFRSVGGNPIFAKRGQGPYIETTTGHQLIDYCLSFGPLILGHAHPDVVHAISEAAQYGTSYAVTTEAEIELAELITRAIPSIQQVRVVNSGTEACMTALRLARGFTRRNKILKFSGCYHGHSDGLLVRAGSGVAGIATASSSGVTESTAQDTLVAPYNDIDRVSRLVNQHKDDLAAIIVEPIAANMGLVPPNPGFLQYLRNLTKQCGALLIFDEVITGFRLNWGGYQNVCDIMPDLTCLGKIIGGGMPIGAIGGRSDIMECIAPLGPVYQAGTLSGNPISVAAGLSTLKVLQDQKPYSHLEKTTVYFVEAIRSAASELNVKIQIPQLGSMFSFFFANTPLHSFEDVEKTKKENFITLFSGLLKEGIYLPPSPFETCFMSTAHDDHILQKSIDTVTRLLRTL